MKIITLKDKSSRIFQIHDEELGYVFDVRFYSQFAEYCILTDRLEPLFSKIDWHAGYQRRFVECVDTHVWCGLIKTGHSLFDLAIDRCEKFLKFLKFELQLVPLLRPCHYMYKNLFFDPSTGTNLLIDYKSEMVEVDQSFIDKKMENV